MDVNVWILQRYNKLVSLSNILSYFYANPGSPLFSHGEEHNGVQ